jgi:HSP20 family molecular chaperone IbpA
MILSRFTDETIDNYPGDYQPPAYNWQSVIEDIKAKPSSKPLTNVSEERDHLKVEVAYPGHHKEDFLACVKDYKLFLTVISTDTAGDRESTAFYHRQEFRYSPLTHEIDLPRNIDPDFVRAEYGNGILTFYFAKGRKNAGHRVERVIVY